MQGGQSLYFDHPKKKQVTRKRNEHVVTLVAWLSGREVLSYPHLGMT